QYRGTPECPGLVFGLDRGGSCRGRVLRVISKDVDEVVAYLYEREMINQVYHPRMIPTTIAPSNGSPYQALSLAFIADRDHIQYTGPIKDDEALKLIRQGHGLGGPCIDYLRNTAEHLRELNIIDHRLEKLIKLNDLNNT
ncbi:MAG: gamma-glutamylcyclotransferase, partial [Rhodospirillales bacterium]|nr:gamma-glutamylcyclotransferase [Rhodospirillales bacterium]